MSPDTLANNRQLKGARSCTPLVSLRRGVSWLVTALADAASRPSSATALSYRLVGLQVGSRSFQPNPTHAPPLPSDWILEFEHHFGFVSQFPRR